MILLTIGFMDAVKIAAGQGFVERGRLPYFAIIILLALILTVCIMIYRKVDKRGDK